MTRILKDFNFAIAYLDNIIIFSKTAEEHLSHIKQVFEKLQAAKLSTKLSKYYFFSQRDSIFRIHSKHQGHLTITFEDTSHPKMNLPTTPKQVHAYLGLVGYYRKFIRNFAKIAKPLTLLTCQQVKFEWTPTHHEAFLKLKESIIQTPILHYPNPNKRYIVYTDAWDYTCGAQLSQEHDGTEFPIAFLSHAFSETQWKWSTTEQEAYGVYYAITTWNYYLQGVYISQKWSQTTHQILNGKNANNNVNRWGLELATYNITFEWISRAHNKAADWLSHLVKSPQKTHQHQSTY